METITIHKAKTELSRLIERACRGEDYMTQSGFESLPVSAAHGIRAGLLPGPQRDPFDRMLIAQAQAEDLTLVSNEVVFDSYGIRRAW
jgi:PIN domain nuclease of toxin-antitoxin system